MYPTMYLYICQIRIYIYIYIERERSINLVDIVKEYTHIKNYGSDTHWSEQVHVQ